jgi:hypothetical protein
MRCTRNRYSGSAITFSVLSLLALSGISTSGDSAQPLHEMSCFTIGAAVECIDAGFIMPPMIVTNPDGEGTDETFIFEDNGGHEEVRG